MSNQVNYATKSDVKDIVREAVDDLSGIIQQFAMQVDERFNKVETRLDRIEATIDRLTNTIDGFVKRLDDIETENTAHDAQFRRLLKWAEKVSSKTGIPLEY